MYKKPPDEDHTLEYPEFTYPAQRRKRPAATNKQSSNGFRADEHPEIPRVRRASLNLDKQQNHHSSRSASVEEADEDESESIKSPKATQPGKIRVTPDLRSSSSTVYSPPPAARPPHRAQKRKSTQHLHTRSPFLIRLQQLSHSRTAKILGIVALI